jgi:predicted MFS family arabinose efflux permease
MATTTSPATQAPRPPQAAPLPFLGLTCAVGVSSIYFNQPLLEQMARSFHSRPEHIGFVAVATQVGYACGLLCFVPLGDVLERRALMMRMFAAVSVALLLVAITPSLLLLVIASFLVGLFASVTHIVLPIAPDLVDDTERGRAIGIVMTGLLLGILLARTFSGWLSRIHGWRLVFIAAAVINLCFVPLLWRKMPKLPPAQDCCVRLRSSAASSSHRSAASGPRSPFSCRHATDSARRSQELLGWSARPAPSSPRSQDAWRTGMEHVLSSMSALPCS